MCELENVLVCWRKGDLEQEGDEEKAGMCLSI